MAPRVSTIFVLLSLILSFVTASHWSRHHHQELAHRARGDVNIHKRQSYTNARFTFYDVGLGACGQYNVASDFIVALNVEQYGNGYPGPMCFVSITIQYGGKTAEATIMDECEGCPWGGLDFSRGLFDYFASESVGVLYGTWWVNGGSSGSGQDTSSSQWTSTSTSQWEPPSTTSTSTSYTPDYTPTTPTPTPAYTPISTSTSSTSTTSTSSTSPPSSIKTSSSYTPSSTFNTSLAVPTGGVVPTPDSSDPQNIFVINNILIEIGIVLSLAEKDG